MTKFNETKTTSLDPTTGVTEESIEITREPKPEGGIYWAPEVLDKLGAAIVETIVERMLGHGNEKATITLSNMRAILGADLTVEIRLPHLEAALAAYKKVKSGQQ